MRKQVILATLVLLSVTSCSGRSSSNKNSSASTSQATAQATQTPTRPAPAKQYTYKVVEVFSHDTKAYTQGLLWHDGYLYESTGLYGESQLRKVDHKTGNVIQSISLERKYFGEGIALLNERIYMLTWTEGRAFVYDLNTFRQLKSFSYDGEGWGLTTDGTKLYMSDGTDKIYVRNPETFAIERTISVRNGQNRVRYINELEWINGEIWANIYTTEQVVRINPETGAVTGIIDFSGIQSRADHTPHTDVFNGIAYDPATDNIYVTGKRWNKLYRVEILEKE